MHKMLEMFMQYAITEYNKQERTVSVYLKHL